MLQVLQIPSLKSKEIVILCSGNNGLFSFEDSVCAGELISELLEIIRRYRIG